MWTETGNHFSHFHVFLCIFLHILSIFVVSLCSSYIITITIPALILEYNPVFTSYKSLFPSLYCKECWLMTVSSLHPLLWYVYESNEGPSSMFHKRTWDFRSSDVFRYPSHIKKSLHIRYTPSTTKAWNSDTLRYKGPGQLRNPVSFDNVWKLTLNKKVIFGNDAIQLCN